MKKESRRHVRELAMQALYFIDTVHGNILGNNNKDKRDKTNTNNNSSNLNNDENFQAKSTLLKKGIRKKKANLNNGNNNKNKNNVLENNINVFCKVDNNENAPEILLDLFWKHFCSSLKSKTFFLQLTNGVIDYRQRIDSIIEKFSNNWKINRMSCVDRNIMRIAVFELLYCDDIPPKVSINEAVDIGKLFGTDDSGPFINGILDSIRIAIDDKNI